MLFLKFRVFYLNFFFIFGCKVKNIRLCKLKVLWFYGFFFLKRIFWKLKVLFINLLLLFNDVLVNEI